MNRRQARGEVYAIASALCQNWIDVGAATEPKPGESEVSEADVKRLEQAMQDLSDSLHERAVKAGVR